MIGRYSDVEVSSKNTKELRNLLSSFPSYLIVMVLIDRSGVSFDGETYVKVDSIPDPLSQTVFYMISFFLDCFLGTSQGYNQARETDCTFHAR